MKSLISLALMVMAIFHVNHFWAQNDYAKKYAETITAQELKEHLYILASDEYEGRETGKRGQKKAAEYLVNYYQSLGIKPSIGDTTYYQTYPLISESMSQSSMDINGQKFDFIKDFFSFNAFQFTGDINLQNAVFLGYGIDSDNYTDYKRVNLKGKVVVVLNGEPFDQNGRSVITGKDEYSEWATDPSLKLDRAKKAGAVGMIIIRSDYDQFVPRVRYWLEQANLKLDYPVKEEEEVIPYFYASVRVADALFTGQKKGWNDLAKKMGGSGKTKSAKLKVSGEIHVERQVERIIAENVLCFIEGSDPRLKNEIVVVSAHYDHVGIINGEIHNGADDDGSGTVGTLEIAEAFVEAKKAGYGPRRSILILNVSGEEKGLLGSEWYSAYPIYPLENTICDLNIDMIGRVDEAHKADSNYIYLIGSDKLSTDLHKISENCNSTYTQLQLDYTYNQPNDPNRFYYRSDHYNFAKHGIPVIFYFSGVHEDYHKPGDDPEKIMYEKLSQVTRLVFYTAWDLANRDERLKVDLKNDFPEE